MKKMKKEATDGEEVFVIEHYNINTKMIIFSGQKL